MSIFLKQTTVSTILLTALALGGPAKAEVATFVAQLSGIQEVPPNASTATGVATVLLDTIAGTITANLNWTGLSAPAAAAHIHGPAAPGVNAAVIFPFAGVPASTSGSIAQQTFAITPAQIAQLQGGLLYVNVHNAVFPGGEIRGQLTLAVPPDALQVKYISNLNIGDGVINITNAGTQNVNGALTNICANVYTFSPDEQLVSCCSCVVTPNALVSLSAISDLVSNTLTPAHPNSIVVKVVATSGTACNASNAPAGNLAGGLRAWATVVKLVDAASPKVAITETAFSAATLSAADLARITSFCGFIQANGSGFGICKSCRLGGQGAVSQ
jgi:CHRD domain-containing protein